MATPRLPSPTRGVCWLGCKTFHVDNSEFAYIVFPLGRFPQSALSDPLSQKLNVAHENPSLGLGGEDRVSHAPRSLRLGWFYLSVITYSFSLAAPHSHNHAM